MRSGLLWFDKSNTPLTDKINKAARRYQEKFGHQPDTCFVNPLDLPAALAVPGITVNGKPTILQHHIWLGVANTQTHPL